MPGLDGAQGHAQEPGDLFVLVTFDVVQDEDGAGAAGQRRDGALQGQTGLGHGAPRFREVAREIGRSLVALLPPAVGAQPAQDDAHGETVEPGAESARAAEGGEGAPGLDESVLGQLLGLAGIARHAQGESVDPPVVEVIQLLERAGVPSPCTGHEPFGRFGESWSDRLQGVSSSSPLVLA